MKQEQAVRKSQETAISAPQMDLSGGSFYCYKEPATYFIDRPTGLIFQRPVPSVAEMVEYADAHYRDGAYKSYTQAAHLKIATFERRIREIRKLAPGGRLLDVGCACGFFLETALRHGFDAWGVEFSKEAIAAAQDDVRERIINGDVNSLLEMNLQPFDVVVAFDIIEHTQNPAEFLAQLRSLLAPGGLLVLSTPDTGHFLRYLMGSRWPMLQPFQHTYLFSRAAMRRLLEQTGYSEVQISTADKSLTLAYLMDQISIHNPLLTRLYQLVSPLLPRRWLEQTFAVNIGEMLAVGRARR